MHDADGFKEFFRSTDPGIEFDETEPVQQEVVEEKRLKGEELDSLVGEVGIERKDGESDLDLRERAALQILETDPQKSLEIALARRKKDWHEDEKLLSEPFGALEKTAQEEFITTYVNREDVSEENQKLMAKFHVMFPQFCVLKNDMREVMSWFLGNVAPWERDPCAGCSHCFMGKK